MPTLNALPGLRDLSSTLDIPINLLLFLIAAIAPRWRAAHPPQRCGRPRAEFTDLLAGTLIYLREATTFRRAAARVGLGRSTLARAFHELVTLIASLGIAQADGTLLRPDQPGALRAWLGEMATAGELALVDAVPTRGPRPGRSWAAQKPMYDPKHGYHAFNTQTLTTECGDLLAVHGGWPGAIHEVTQLRHSHFAAPLRESDVAVVTDAGYRPARRDFGVIARAGKFREPAPGDREIARARAENERPHALLKAWRSVERTRIRPCVKVHAMVQAVAVLVGLLTYGQRVAGWPTQA